MQKFGFVFPGQGSQKPGMLRELAARHPVVEATFAEAADAIGLNLWQIVQSDTDDRLNQTHITQPALLAASVAIWRAWQQCDGPEPAILAGHSLGEYSALVCADVLDFVAATQLVFQRGQFMQAAVAEGSGKMAAIVGLDDAQILQACAEAAEDEIVSAANYNSPGQTVIAGTASAVERAMALCKAKGAKRALPLNVSVPSHCALMKPAADQLEEVLSETRFKPARIPVVQNVNAQIGEDPGLIQQNIIRQLYQPVQWVDSVRLMHSAGALQLVECGPGKVLSGLIRRIEPAINCFGSDDCASFDNALAEMTA